ncbi:hypothetical protein [Flavobacterium sp. 3HN19-14]|uniref:hypothetical protein n=1 Tax=Flavobacterium sp. 3HN19-14 TaxID=3448133 RepID=UPI003EE3495E
MYTAFRDKANSSEHAFMHDIVLGAGCILFFGGGRLVTRMLTATDESVVKIDESHYPIIIKGDFRKNLLFLLGSLIFTLAGLVFIFFPKNSGVEVTFSKSPLALSAYCFSAPS